MTKEENSSKNGETVDNYHKLSIQVSLNGLSFCVLDTIGNTIPLSRRLEFGKELSPYEVLKELKAALHENRILSYGFSEVVVIHRNHLFSLVPKPLFDKNELANYLKFNTRILANDLLEYDELFAYEMVNVYIPFMNINNYIYELFGEFDFMHHGTVLIQSLLSSHSNGKEAVCYVHVAEQQMDVAVISQKQLLFYNSFSFLTKEDFLYYLLFTLEQLKLSTETIKTRLFGSIHEGDELYAICNDYIHHLSIFIPSQNTAYPFEDPETESIDFTLLSAL